MAETLPTHASALFDATFRLHSWSFDFARLIGMDPLRLAQGVPFADLLIQRPGEGPGGRALALQQVSGKLTLDVIRGRAPGRMRVLLPDSRILDVMIEPHAGGVIVVTCRYVPPAAAAGGEDATRPQGQTQPRRRGALQSLIDAVPVALFFVDQDRVIRACNGEFATWTREERPQIVGKRMAALLPADLNAELARFFADLADTGQPSSFEWTLRDRRDRERYVRIQLAKLDPVPGTTEGVLVSILDLTEERALQLLSKKNMEMLRALLQASPVAIAIMRAHDGVILFANDRVAQLLGRATLPAGENGDRLLLRGMLPVLVSDIVSNGRLKDYPLQIQLPDGSPRDLLTTIDLIEYEDERALLWWGYDVTRLQARQETLTRQAYADALTGLPNRLAFDVEMRELLKAAQRGRRGALLLLDLDGFKSVNDTYGHDAGDYLLDQVGARLTSTVRDRDFVARLGGDEFAILLRDFDPEAVGMLGQRIIDAVSRPIAWKGMQLGVGVSIGVAAVTDPQGPAADLYKHADLALYDAKRAGKGVTRFYAGPAAA